MAKRFFLAPVPKGEEASYVSDPNNQSAIFMFGNNNPFTGNGANIVRPSDETLIAKGGSKALSTYQRLLLDEQVQGSFSKLTQEVTSRPWFIKEFSGKPGDVAVKDFVLEALSGLDIDDLCKSLAEAMIVGFSVSEVMWRKTKAGIVPFDLRMRDQRRFVFEESPDANSGFTMRCLTFNDMFKGNELPARKFIINRHWTVHNGDPYGAALGRILYPLVKFRRRAIESYVLFGDRFATPTAIATAPLSASPEEIDALYAHISNLSQETALVLPDGFTLRFENPSGNPEIFINLIEYLDREISLLLCGENEAGQSESGSRASSQVANTVRVVKASELSETICTLLTRTLVRWIVDLNYGTDVSAPTFEREFRIEESELTVSDVSQLQQMNFKPTKDWVSRQFRVEFEDEDDKFSTQEGGDETFTKYNPQEDTDLFGDIFGDETESAGAPADETTPPEEEAAATDTPPEEPAEEGASPPKETPPEEAGRPPTEEDITPQEEFPTEEPLSPSDQENLFDDVFSNDTETTPQGNPDGPPSDEDISPQEEVPTEEPEAQADPFDEVFKQEG